MNPRPSSITVIGWLFVCVGVVSLVRHLASFVMTAGSAGDPRELRDVVYASISALVALASGMFMLRGCNGARWICAAWMVFHIFLSISHSQIQLLTHVILFTPILYFLFRAPANIYFSPQA
jgi:hypothetical protein